MTQTRWLCRECDREMIESKYTVSSGGLPVWTQEMGCPGCGSTELEERTYHAPFPGGDIPRGDSAPVVMAHADRPSTVQQPPHVLTSASSEEDALVAQWEALGRP